MSGEELDDGCVATDEAEFLVSVDAGGRNPETAIDIDRRAGASDASDGGLVDAVVNRLVRDLGNKD